jgi:hypothetical protein
MLSSLSAITVPFCHSRESGNDILSKNNYETTHYNDIFRTNTISWLPNWKCLTRKMHLHNADVVKKFIFRYLSVPLTDGYWNILMDITNKDIPNKLSS